MARKLKQIEHTSTLAAIEDAVNTLRDELGEEMRSWYDNMSENLQGGEKGTAVDDAAAALEQLSDFDIPDALRELTLIYTTEHKGGRKGDPRWLRRDNELAVLNAATAAVEAFIDAAQAALNESDEDEITIDAVTYNAEDLEALIAEAQTLMSEIDDMIGEVEGVEFPGMYG